MRMHNQFDQRVNHLGTRNAAGAMIALIALAGGCGSSNEVWTTKNQSMLGVRTDAPALNVDSELPVAGPTLTATELREPAVSLLLQAADSPSALLRANAIEALHHAPEHLEPIVRRGLGDENRGVRFVAAMTVGKFQIRELGALLAPMLHDESPSVRAAAMYGLRRCGKPVDINPLSDMLFGEDPEAKGNAAFVLGEMGDRTAIELLRLSSGQGLSRTASARRKVVELQVAEALVKLGSSRELDVIRAAIYSTAEEAELAALACQMAGELKDGAALADLTNIVHRSGPSVRPAEVRMAAALAVARLDPTRSLVEVPAEYASNQRPALRAQAAHTLGAMSSGGKDTMVALSHLSRLLNDPDPMVQVAAAGAILQIQPRERF